MKEKKALCIASVASNLDNFNRENVKILQSLGYKITLASNFDTEEDVNSEEKIKEFKAEMLNEGIEIEQIDFSRKITNISQQIKSILQVKKLLENNFDLIHCHSPICAAITRMAAKKYRFNYGTKVIYTAHGFHFFNGAPIKNWLVFYPVEKILSKYTDVLITINGEDYKRALKEFNAKKTEYIHGIGIDIDRFDIHSEGTETYREKLGIKNDDIMILSVGELSARKNHEAVIRALGELQESKIHYFIAGIGKMLDHHKRLAESLGVENNIHFLGYRTDIAKLCKSSDIYIFPSLQEGLPVALMEPIACMVPVICSDIRGNRDLVHSGRCLFNPHEIESIKQCIITNIFDKNRKTIRKEFAEQIKENRNNLVAYEKQNVNKEMERIYKSI